MGIPEHSSPPRAWHNDALELSLQDEHGSESRVPGRLKAAFDQRDPAGESAHDRADIDREQIGLVPGEVVEFGREESLSSLVGEGSDCVDDTAAPGVQFEARIADRRRGPKVDPRDLVIKWIEPREGQILDGDDAPRS